MINIGHTLTGTLTQETIIALFPTNTFKKCLACIVFLVIFFYWQVNTKHAGAG